MGDREVVCRVATSADLEEVSALTRSHRHRLATWAPRWWRIAEGADDLHPLWIGHLMTSDQAVVRVATSGGDVVATAISLAQADRWVIDDVAIVDDTMWPEVGPALVTAVAERPALTCVATADRARAEALRVRGSTLASTYWVRPTGPPAPSRAEGSRRRSAPRRAVPPHTFGAGFDPDAPGALVVRSSSGTLVGSPSTPAPPVYDPGGPVTVIDSVFGDDLDALLETALDLAARRGDALVAVVCAPDDDPLHGALADGGFARTVEVHRWPGGIR